MEDLLSFLSACPTSWHTVAEVKRRLTLQGFSPLEEGLPWSLQRGGRYFVARGGSVAAFCLPSSNPSQITLLAAHTDSPALKLKPTPLINKQEMTLLEVEVYGAPILHSWLNRDLALAGRVFLEKEGTIEEHLIFLQNDPLIIPELAIHLHRDVNEKGPFVNKQDHLMPLVTWQSPPPSLASLLGIENILSFDLLLVPLEAPRKVGKEGQGIASYRLDNLSSVHSALVALSSYQDSPLLPLALFFDHEEIGSTSWEGAQSTFLPDLLSRLYQTYSLSEEEILILKRHSLALSLDVAHAFNPMHVQKYDPNHAPLLGKGPVLKHNASLKYASSGYSSSLVLRLAKRAGLSLQQFVSRSDEPCGSTIGPLLTSSLGIPTADIGCALLSMHSAREVGDLQDHLDMITLLKESLIPLNQDVCYAKTSL